MRATPSWHIEARALRAEGKTPAEIAKALGRERPYVVRVLNENGEMDRSRLASRRHHEAVRAKRKASKAKAAKSDTLTIARRYVAGEFDRHEMMRILRGESNHAA